MKSRDRPLRILIIDADPDARRRAVLAVEEEVDLAVVGEGSDGVDAVLLVDRLHPDVVVIDIELPGMAANEATATITEGWPTVAVVGIAPDNSDEDVRDMMRSGAIAILKEDEIHKLPAVVRRASELLEEMYPDPKNPLS